MIQMMIFLLGHVISIVRLSAVSYQLSIKSRIALQLFVLTVHEDTKLVTYHYKITGIDAIADG